MYIGEVATKTGASPRAIRLYESQGLITPPARKGKYRVYTSIDVDMIHIIKEAQHLGFQLAEIKNLLDSDVTCSNFPWVKAIKLLQEKNSQIQHQVNQLRQQMEEIKALIHFIENREI